MKKILTNKQIIELSIERAGVENNNQLAAYLTEKYGINISRQMVTNFQASDKLTITHLLLREALE